MSKILMKCRGTNCELRNSCYRYTAEFDLPHKNYFDEPPIKDGDCDFFWLNPMGRDELIKAIEFNTEFTAEDDII